MSASAVGVTFLFQGNSAMRHNFNNGRVVVEHIKRRPMTSVPIRAERRPEVVEAVRAPVPPSQPTLRLFPHPSAPQSAPPPHESGPTATQADFEAGLEAALRNW